MDVQFQKGHQDTEKSERDKHLDENFKILKQAYFKSGRRYNIIHGCIEYEGICCYI